MPIVGISVAPDNVAYPLAKTARVMVGEGPLLERFGAPPGQHFPVNTALLWAQDPSRSDVLVSAARQSSFGLRGLRFLTRSGVEALVGQAAGIVVALLVAFGVVATGLAGVLLGAGAQSEVQRALDRIGLQRALGVTPGAVVAVHATRGALVAAPAAAFGLVAGALAGRVPTERVLASLNELPPSTGRLLMLLTLVWLCAVALVAGASALPAWRAARRAPAALLRGGDVAAPRRRGGATRRGGLTALGARLVVARRLRFASVVAVLGAAASVVLLLLALASLLQALRDDPATLGKRYQLTTRLPDSETDAVEAIPGVEAAAVRYSTDAVSALSLGSPLKVIAYSSGDHTRFEAPPLASGRRAHGAGEAEVGLGLADALGLRPGSTLAIQPLAQREVRFRVVGVVRALQDEGRVAYVAPDRLLAAGVGARRADGPAAEARRRPRADRRGARRARRPRRRRARRDRRQQRVPRRPRRAAADRCRDGRARVPARAGQRAGADGPRAARRGRDPARGRRRRSRAAPAARRRGARGRRSPPIGRGDRPGGDGALAARRAPRRGLRRPAARRDGRPDRARRRRPARCSPGPPPW